MNERLLHDVSWATAVAMVDGISGLRDEERMEFVHFFYEHVKGTVEYYMFLRARELKRLGKNEAKSEPES